MIDLHTHSFLSDGVLVPTELFRRAQKAGYSHLAVADHVDGSNIEFIAKALVRAYEDWNSLDLGMQVLPAVELTHLPPSLIDRYAKTARNFGAKIVVVHGETLMEPVAPGTNRAAIEAKVDVLAHPGLIEPELAELAAKNNVALEITAHKGHNLSNGHVAQQAARFGARLVLDSDAHRPEDLISDDFGLKVVLGSGLTREDFAAMQRNALEIFQANL